MDTNEPPAVTLELALANEPPPTLWRLFPPWDRAPLLSLPCLCLWKPAGVEPGALRWAYCLR